MTNSKNSLEMSSVLGEEAKVEPVRFFAFWLSCMLPFVLAWSSMRVLFKLILGNETFSQIPLIPLVSVFLVYENRKMIFRDVSFGWGRGAAFIVSGIVALGVARFHDWPGNSVNQNVLLVLGIVFIWMGMFAVFFGAHAFRAAIFPLMFLLFTIPIPEPVLSNLIAALQQGSADLAEKFFQLAHIPYFRQDLIFELPSIRIRVAEECSGIRSTLALLITTVLAGHLFLRQNWRKWVLILVVVPVAIFKNGLRIATLSALAVYVDPAFLKGNLHHRGGIVFFMIALVPMALFLLWLEKGENPKARASVRA